jgi:hypothetical protein
LRARAPGSTRLAQRSGPTLFGLWEGSRPGSGARPIREWRSRRCWGERRGYLGEGSSRVGDPGSDIWLRSMNGDNGCPGRCKSQARVGVPGGASSCGSWSSERIHQFIDGALNQRSVRLN